MPKKFKGENSKAVEARARKTAQKEEEEERKQRQLEEEYWKDDDKHVLKKQQRKEEKDKKKTEQVERKKEAQKILDEEVASIAAAKSKAPPPKLTRADVDIHRLNVAAVDKAAVAASTKTNVEDLEPPIEENVNRIQLEGDHARTVEEAINILSIKEPEVDMHPEKRMKAAYLAFEEKNLPILKQEYSNLRLSQLKQMLKKDWAKSPENPLNQKLAATH